MKSIQTTDQINMKSIPTTTIFFKIIPKNINFINILSYIL